MKDLEGKVVLVSGVGPGLGRAVADRALARGANVVLGDIAPHRLGEIADELDPSGRRVVWAECDITDDDSCRELVARGSERFHGIDALVNVAAFDTVFGSLMNSAFDEWDPTIEVNVKGTLRMTRAAVPALKARGRGSIVIIGSVGFIKPPTNAPHQLAYASSKGALMTAMRYLAAELGPDGIRVNTVTPGWKLGPVLEGYLRSVAEEQGVEYGTVLEPIKSSLALRELATDYDVGEAALFLCSEQSRLITGQNIHVDGGEIFG
ncbi:SDR family oxidoreductase [Streptomyces sp. NPDC005480]|uniref:SDR family oxidoreductase n=1 Tax=Streptomyces sp. NPDC005480 TaxID=3154880 RepID=UPI0033A76F4E